MTTSGRSFSTQSMRRSPPALVSPLTPALITRYSKPSRRRRASSTAGYASSGETPSPAVRLSPSAAMTWSAADAGDATSRRRTTGSARRRLTLRV